MKKYLVLFLVLTSGLVFSQSINDYKYAIVPSKFSFLKENDQYRLNTLTKMFMEKYGFVTYFDTDILPTEVANQNCNKVYVDVESHGTMFMSKLNVVLKDCKNNVLFTSAEGKSKEKEYNVAYNQALREAFNSFDALGYKYNGSITSVETVVVKTTNDGATIKKEVVPTNANTSISTAALFAQPIANGFQLIDNTPKVVLKIYNTSVKEIYIAEGNQGKGVLYPKNGDWIFEYYANGILMSETFKVKF